MTLKRKLDADFDDVSPVVFTSSPIADVVFIVHSLPVNQAIETRPFPKY